MLKLLSISGPKDSRAIFAEFQSEFAVNASTWIVSDLKSKLDLNRRLLVGRSFLDGDTILRASELWRVMLSRLRPDLHIGSRELVITLIAQKLALREEGDWSRAPGAPQAAFAYLSQLIPVLSHPDGDEMMREWLQQNPTALVRWGRWYELCSALWRELLSDGFIAMNWASGVLTNEPDLHQVWNRPLWVDLGADLDQVEADLFIMLAEACPVTILRPEPSWVAEYQHALVAYDVFTRRAKPDVVSRDADFSPEHQTLRPNVHFKKFTTMIAEVKDAVARVRQWLDAGLAANEIALVAPDIELYWPTLESHLREEGVPCQKDVVARLHSFPDMAGWLAHLRLKSGAWSEADVELALFQSSGSETPRVMGYERFKTLYTMIYERSDLSRSEDVAKRFSIELEAGAEIGRDDFVAWMLRHLPQAGNSVVSRPTPSVSQDELLQQHLEVFFKRFFADCPSGLRLSVSRWLAFAEKLAARTELRIMPGDAHGVTCVSLGSAENTPAKKMIVLGLTESALKPSGGTAILFSDIMSLAQLFGFHLSSADQGSSEFAARWVIEDSDREVWLSVPETDFNGAAQAASWLWVKGAREAGEHQTVSVPEPTRWDELQLASLRDVADIANNRSWSPLHREFLEQALSQDLGETPLESFGPQQVSSLSPSGLEDYLNCPFIYAAKRLFAQSDVAELDLEVDPSRRGSLMHKLLELLTLEPMKFDRGPEELAAVVDEARVQTEMELADEAMWATTRSRMVDLAQRFLEFEREKRRRFPSTQTVGREVEVRGRIDPETGCLLPASSESGLKFTGRIDRIDRDSKGNLLIYDYKSSGTRVVQFGSWIKRNQIQLLLYADAVQSGLTEFGPHPVVGALYYVTRPLTHETGFKVEDVEQDLFASDDKRKRNRLSQADLEQLVQQGRERVRTAIEGIQSGRFSPEPSDLSLCQTCQWSDLCRAPHLNR